MQRLDTGLYRKLSESKLSVWVSHASWKESKEMTLAELHNLGKDKNKLEDFTQGPFKDFKNDLTASQQQDWQKINDGKNTGCTVQLTETAKQIDPCDTMFIAYNTQEHAVQSDILKAKPEYKDMYMVHADEQFRKEFGLQTFEFQLTGKVGVFLKDRRIIAASKTGQVAEFVDADMRDPKTGNTITLGKMTQVLEAAKAHFLGKKVQQEPERSPSPTLAGR